MTKDELKEAVTGAVARGWCSKANENKEFDVDLASAIASEVWTEVAAYLHERSPLDGRPGQHL